VPGAHAEQPACQGFDKTGEYPAEHQHVVAGKPLKLELEYGGQSKQALPGFSGLLQVALYPELGQDEQIAPSAKVPGAQPHLPVPFTSQRNDAQLVEPNDELVQSTSLEHGIWSH